MSVSSLPASSSPDGGFLLAWLRLHLIALYQPAALDVLLKHEPDLAGLFRTRTPALPWEELPRGLRKKLADPSFAAKAEAELVECRKRRIDIVTRLDPLWPINVVELPLMPLLLFGRGELKPEIDQRAIAIVGSRHPTPYGRRQARRFARVLASRGATVVSGLARGIDGEAHAAALEAGGRTIAVLGSGLGRIYPSDHRGLAERVSRCGVLLSEFPSTTAPLRHHFPQRNRILSALSLGLLVVEAGEKSGSLLTVDWALQQGRPVFVVPGRVEDTEARGSLRLIQSGAIPVIDPEEILEALPDLATPGPKNQSTDTPTPEETDDPLVRRLRELFQERDSWHPDAIATRLGHDPGALVRDLLRLEAAGVLEKARGGQYVLR
jgi:DNA processing protein